MSRQVKRAKRAAQGAKRERQRRRRRERHAQRELARQGIALELVRNPGELRHELTQRGLT